MAYDHTGEEVGDHLFAPCAWPGCTATVAKNAEARCGGIYAPEPGVLGCGQHFCPNHLYASRTGVLCPTCSGMYLRK